MEKGLSYYIELYKKTFDASLPYCYLQYGEETLIEIIKESLAEGHPLEFDEDPTALY